MLTAEAQRARRLSSCSRRKILNLRRSLALQVLEGQFVLRYGLGEEAFGTGLDRLDGHRYVAMTCYKDNRQCRSEFDQATPQPPRRDIYRRSPDCRKRSSIISRPCYQAPPW